jgi:hypothetical protein
LTEAAQEPPAAVGWSKVLVAEAEDLVSRRMFRVWYDRRDDAQNGRRYRLRRKRTTPFLVEDVGVAAIVAMLGSWKDVLAWHDRTVISPGWRIVTQPSDLGEPAETSVAAATQPILSPETF